jgi:hypothetical protein
MATWTISYPDGPDGSAWQATTSDLAPGTNSVTVSASDGETLTLLVSVPASASIAPPGSSLALSATAPTIILNPVPAASIHFYAGPPSVTIAIAGTTLFEPPAGATPLFATAPRTSISASIVPVAASMSLAASPPLISAVTRRPSGLFAGLDATEIPIKVYGVGGWTPSRIRMFDGSTF